jgi:hypothetical protein
MLPHEESSWLSIAHCAQELSTLDPERFVDEVLPYMLTALRVWPDALRTPLTPWLDQLANEEGAHPCLALVRCLDRSPSANNLAKTIKRIVCDTSLKDVTILRGDKINNLKLYMLSNSPMMPSLKTLHLGSASYNVKKLHLFGKMSSLTALHANFAASHGDDIIEVLETHGRLPALEALWMGFSGVALEGVRRLACASHLRELALWSNPGIKTAGVQALCAGALADAPLELLNLGGCDVDADGVALLARQRWPLTHLLLWANSLGADQIASLASAPLLSTLTLLNIADSQFVDDALAPLLARRGASALRELWLARCPEIGLASLEAAARGDILRQLHVLHLEGSELSDPARCGALTAALDGGQLTTLHMSNTSCGDAGARALASAQLPALRRLDLSNNQLTAEGLGALLRSAWIGELEALDLSANGLTPSVIPHIADAATRLARLHITVQTAQQAELGESMQRYMPHVILGKWA